MDNNEIMGKEKISKLLFKFSMPCVTGLLISAFYNIIDQIFIGHSNLGYIGNAATGISFPVICIANAFAWCIGDGGASYLSICAGRKDTESSHKCVGTAISSSAIISLILATICVIFNKPLMYLFGASENTIIPATDYFGIIALFFPVYLLMNILNSMIRADGSPAFAMVSISSGAVINIILDPLFIFVFDLGIKGAAYATVIGQVISCSLCALYFFKPKNFKLSKNSFKIDCKILKNLIGMGGSTFIIQISIVLVSLVSNMTLFRYGALSVYGSDIPISVFSIQSKVSIIVNNIVVGITLGGQPILGYNYGAGKMGRVKDTYKLVFKICLITGVIATLIFELFPRLVIGMFGGGNELYYEFAVKTFRIYLSFTVFTCIIKMSAIFFQSIGKSMQAMLSSLIRDIICFIPLTLGLSYLFEKTNPGKGIYGILYAAPIADIIAGVVVIALAVVFFRSLDKKTENKKEAVIKPTKQGVIITIARQHGSCGKQIGKLIAEKLGVPFYYKEMTALAAKESGLAEEFISGINQQNQSEIFHKLYLSSNVITQAVIAQEKIIRKIADEGSCVIVGRAADFVLKDYDNMVSVFFHAPENVRINNIMEMYGDSYEDAKINMIKSDEARSAYYKNISGKRWQDLNNYNLCIDSSVGKEETAELVVDYINKIK